MARRTSIVYANSHSHSPRSSNFFLFLASARRAAGEGYPRHSAARKIPPGDVTWRDLESRANRRSSSNHFLPRNPQTNPRRRPFRFRETRKITERPRGRHCAPRADVSSRRADTPTRTRGRPFGSPRVPPRTLPDARRGRRDSTSPPRARFRPGTDIILLRSVPDRRPVVPRPWCPRATAA